MDHNDPTQFHWLIDFFVNASAIVEEEIGITWQFSYSSDNATASLLICPIEVIISEQPNFDTLTYTNIRQEDMTGSFLGFFLWMLFLTLLTILGSFFLLR